MDTTRHAGRTAIVTGAGSGIGRAIAVRLAAEGAAVIGCDLDQEGLDATATLAEGTFVAADITSQADVERLVAQAGDVDVLVNNAGIMDHFLPLTETPDDLWERVLAVNLGGVMRVTRAVLPGMVERGRGAVVTVGSEASIRGGVSGVAYAASKHGVIGLVKHVAYFYGPKGIRSNAVLPGGVETGIASTAAPQSQWAIERSGMALASMSGLAQPDEIAAVISWVASDEASNVNGAIVAADGGWSAA